MSKSLIAFIMLSLCMILYWFSGYITRKLKIFKNVDSEKLDKCQIYIFELIGLSYAFIYLLYEGTLNIIFKADDYADIDPAKTLRLIRSLSSLVFLMYLYCIEMLTNSLRWSLKLHHMVIIFAACYFIWILDDFADLAVLRCGLCFALYALTEQNVFAQLLLYRIAPLFSWWIHLVSAILYVLTRIFITCAFMYCYIEWAMTDEIKYQFNGTNKAHYPYLIYFFIMPIANILLNIAQFQTIKALFYVSKSVYKRIKERKRLLKYPRLQILYDIFIEFDTNDNGYWTMMEFKKFIFYHSTFIKHDTCIMLWNVLGFTYEEIISDINLIGSNSNLKSVSEDIISEEELETSPQPIELGHYHRNTLTAHDLSNFCAEDIGIKKREYMRWKDFRKIFGEHLKFEKFKEHSVKQIISAQLQILLQTIFDAQAQFEKFNDIDDKDQAMLKLYRDVNQLIGESKNKKRDENNNEKHVKQPSNIEMILQPPNISNNNNGGDSNGDGSRQLRKIVSMSLYNHQTLKKQLSLDDAIRSNLTRPVSIMMASPGQLETETTI
eukprot:249427_1